MKLDVLIFMLMLWLAIAMAGCNSSKSVQTERSAQIHLQDSSYTHLDRVVSERADISRVGDIDENVVIEFTTYTAPDSSGKQHVKTRGKIQKKRNEQQTEILHHNKDETVDSSSFNNIKKDLQQTEEHKAENHKESSSSLILNLYLAIFIFIVLYKLIQWLR